MATDNPIMEPGDVFYKTTEETELEEPTEPKAVTNGEDQDTEKPDNPEEQEGEPEEKESDDESETTDDDQQDHIYLELDGKEVDLEEVRQWRDGHLRQSDYTRKTMEAAHERNAVKAQSDENATIKNGLLALQAELQAVIQEDESIKWDELREDDPEGYIEAKERADKRKATAEKVKGQLVRSSITQEELVSEQKILYAANPSWIDDKGKQTKEMSKDAALLDAWWTKNGFTADETSSMVRARYIDACLKAAKFDELQEKSKAFIKKAKKAVLVTKPKSQARKMKPKNRPLEEIFYNS